MHTYKWVKFATKCRRQTQHISFKNDLLWLKLKTLISIVIFNILIIFNELKCDENITTNMYSVCLYQLRTRTSKNMNDTKKYFRQKFFVRFWGTYICWWYLIFSILEKLCKSRLKFKIKLIFLIIYSYVS